MINKYNVQIPAATFAADINRLTNQLWKLIPMRENNEDWQTQVDTVLLELIGLNEILEIDEKFLILISKLEGLKIYEVDFHIYRKTVFETISLLREISYE